jgi:hypothetical protein
MNPFEKRKVKRLRGLHPIEQDANAALRLAQPENFRGFADREAASLSPRLPVAA